MHLPNRKKRAPRNDQDERKQDTIALECPVPRRIDQERREQIRRAYQSAVERVGHREDEYVQERLERVVWRLQAQGDASSQLAKIARALGHAYFLERNLERRIADPGSRHVLAALHYLCDPYDVMPDFGSSGYLDDALVINRCLAVLRNRWGGLYRSVLEAA